MYETMMTRHSTMMVGPTGGGKTVIITTLVKAQTDLGLPTKLTVLNPKVRSIDTETYTKNIQKKLNFSVSERFCVSGLFDSSLFL